MGGPGPSVPVAGIGVRADLPRPMAEQVHRRIAVNHPPMPAQLSAVGALIEERPSLEDGLKDLAEVAARALGVGRCSVMLTISIDEPPGRGLKVYSHFGSLPSAAYERLVPLANSIAGRVVTECQPLLIEDLARSDLAPLSSQAGAGGGSMMAAPILIGGECVGVVNVSQPLDQEPFTAADLELLTVLALFTGKSIQVFELQHLAESRLRQMATLLDERNHDPKGHRTIAPDPARLAKLVAKNLYRELAQAGFGPSAIIAVATEVLALLNENLAKHKARAARQTGGDN